MTSSQNTKSTKRISDAAKAQKALDIKIGATYKRLRRLGYTEAAAARQARNLNTK